MHVQGEPYPSLLQSQTSATSMEAGCAAFCQIPLRRQFISWRRLFWDRYHGCPGVFWALCWPAFGSQLRSCPGLGAVVWEEQSQGGNGGLQNRGKIPHHTPPPKSFCSLCSRGSLKLSSPCKVRKTQRSGWEVGGISWSGTAGKAPGLDLAQHPVGGTTDRALCSWGGSWCYPQNTSLLCSAFHPPRKARCRLGDALVKDQPARSVFTALLAPAAFLCWASEGVRGKT